MKVLFCIGGDLGSLVQVAPALEWLSLNHKVSVHFGECFEEDAKILSAYQKHEEQESYDLVIRNHFFGNDFQGSKYLPPLKGENERVYNLRLVKEFADPAVDMDFQKSKLSYAELDLSFLPDKYIVINPQTDMVGKNWPYFSELCQYLRNVIVIGKKEVKNMYAWPDDVKYFLDKSVLQYGALLKRATFVLSAESGIAQYSHFLGTPAVQIIGQSSSTKSLHKGFYAIRSTGDCVSCEDWNAHYPSCERQYVCLMSLKHTSVGSMLVEILKEKTNDLVITHDGRLIERMKVILKAGDRPSVYGPNAEKLIPSIENPNVICIENYTPKVEIKQGIEKALLRAKNSEHWTPLEFKKYLEKMYGEKNVRVECLGDWMLGCCGYPSVNDITMTCPLYNEEEWIELVCQSFMGVCNEMVLGIDKKTSDKTEEIVRKYTDKIHYFEFDEEGKLGKLGGFSGARNSCIDKCTSEYIFMTEGHEHLHPKSWDTLINRKLNPEYRVFFVERQVEGASNVRFPWIFKRDSDIHFESACHNQITTNDANERAVNLEDVATVHKLRNSDHEKRRKKQREKMNVMYFKKQIENGEDVPRSYFYIGSELMADRKWVEAAESYLNSIKNDDQHDRIYQSRINAAGSYYYAGKLDEAEKILLPAVADVWDRNEHYNTLAEIYLVKNDLLKAEQFVKIAATFSQAPFSVYFVQPESYTYRPLALLFEVYKRMQRIPQSAEVYQELKTKYKHEHEVRQLLEIERKNGNAVKYESYLESIKKKNGII